MLYSGRVSADLPLFDSGQAGGSRLRGALWIGTVVVVGLILASLAFNVARGIAAVQEGARSQARQSFEIDLLYRRWAAMHGGVYVPVTAQTRPNPYLEAEHREIPHPDGRTLTLVNPAYMTRQAHELRWELDGIRSHITSLDPLRPDNAPDAWEAEALRSFQSGVEEVSALRLVDGVQTLRLMRPVFSEQACLGCHAEQGYQLGELGGGISVDVPMPPLMAIHDAAVRPVILGHLLLVLVTIATGLVVDRSMRRRQRERELARREHAKLSEQLTQSQKMESIGLLAGGLAHDFNNMLAVILGNAQLVRDELEDAELLELMDDVIEGATRSSELTAKLLAFARKGRLELRAQPLAPLCEELIGLLRRTLSKKIRIEATLDSSLAVAADHTQLFQALLNIAMNGADAMPAGGTLSIHARAAGPDELAQLSGRTLEGCVVEVRDTGEGMDPEAVARAVEPFFTTKATGRGTGLGLSVSLGIIQSHGGHLKLTSEVGVGTTAIIHLPLVSKVSPRAPVPLASTPSGLETVLVVDDEPAVLRTSRRILERAGYRVAEAASGREGVERYRAQAEVIDLVLLDMMMPDLEGGEVFDLLRAQDPTVRVLLCSGFSQQGAADRLIQRGAMGFVDKPPQRETLLRAVRQALDAKT
jgi:signal transduction histidine kinase/ActR/RegA family two-component response regulator